MKLNRRVLAPVFFTAALLLSSNGLLGTLIPVRAGLEGFSTNAIGFIGGAYYLGFMLGCAYAARFVAKVGHIRAFAVFASVGASGALLHVMIVDVAAWAVIRAIAGVCFAGQFVVLESWLNEMTSNAQRGRTLGMYRIVDMGAVIVGQYMLAFADPKTFFLFSLIAIFYMLSLVPISSSRQPTPNTPPSLRISIRRTLLISPLAFWGVFAAGLTNGGFRSLGPVFAQSYNMSMADIATFMNAMLIGGALMQIPFGWASDRYDRRVILLLVSVGAAAGGSAVVGFSEQGISMAAGTVFLFGAFAMPLFSIALSHANDFAKRDEFVQLSATLMMIYGFGAAVGPLVGSISMEWFGPEGFFIYTTAIHLIFFVFGLIRAAINRVKPAGNVTPFQALPRTSPSIFQIAVKDDETNSDPEKKGP